MKKNSLIAAIIWLATTGFVWGNPTLKTIQIGGFEREYMVYTPQNSQQKQADGVIVCLHGFSRTMNDFFDEYNVTAIADSLNLIMIAPQALPEQNQEVISETNLINSFTNSRISLNSVWGCGLSVKVNLFGLPVLDEELNRDINDVDFINRIIDNVLSEYSLPAQNIFMLGTSMGGYMTYQFALKQGARLSGLISIAGSMGLSIKGMDYSTKVPVCDFHSVTDEVVPYTGSYVQSLATIYLGMNMNTVISYWVETNAAGTPPVVEPVQNYPSTNGITVEKYTYPASYDEVIHYKITGASHSYFFKKENGDCMDFAEEISRFIRSHLSGSLNQVPDITAQKTFFYPNPVQDNIYFNTKSRIASIYDITGKEIFSQSFLSGQINLASLKPGIYVIKLDLGNSVQIGKLIKR